MKTPFAVFVLAVSLLAAPAGADDVSLGEPTYGGTGCPDGSASLTIGSDGKFIRLHFDSFVAEAGADKSSDRKSCNLAVPVHVPAGLSVSLPAIEFRGVGQIPAAGEAQFRVETFFSGSRGEPSESVLKGPIGAAFTIRVAPPADATAWSACGADVILRVNAALRATADAAAPASIRIDNANLYSVSTKPC